MSRTGKGKDSFSTNQPVSTTAPRAPGGAGKGGNWRAGIPTHGQAAPPIANHSKSPRPATQGGSVANMGNNMPVTGHNVPRGFASQNKAARGILATGSTPLAHTGTKKYKAALVEGPSGGAASYPTAW